MNSSVTSGLNLDTDSSPPPPQSISPGTVPSHLPSPSIISSGEKDSPTSHEEPFLPQADSDVAEESKKRKRDDQSIVDNGRSDEKEERQVKRVKATYFDFD